MVVAQGDPRGRAALPADPVERGRPDAPEAGSFGRRVPRTAREDERCGGPRTRARRFAKRWPVRVAADRGAFVCDPWGSRGAEVAGRPPGGHRKGADRNPPNKPRPKKISGIAPGGKKGGGLP